MLHDKLLVGRGSDGIKSQLLFVFSSEGKKLSTITSENNEPLMDATWTPRGNIVYTTWWEKVVVISESGNVIINHSHFIEPLCLSVSADNLPIIYLAAGREISVYQSIDDGLHWSIAFNLTERMPSRILQAIKVNTDHGDDFWTVGRDNKRIHHLRVYNMEYAVSATVMRNINTTISSEKGISLDNSKLAHDDNLNIFVSDSNRAIHLFAVSGDYRRQLLSIEGLRNHPYSLAVDRDRQLLYVGEYDGLVQVFKLIYEDE